MKKLKKRLLPLILSFATLSLLSPVIVSCNDNIEVARPTFKVNETSYGKVVLKKSNGSLNLNEIIIGDVIITEITSNEGYVLSTLTVNNENIFEQRSFVVTENIQYTVEATFIKQDDDKTMCEVSIDNQTAEYGYVLIKNDTQSSNLYPLNSVIELEIHAQSGYELDILTVNGKDIKQSKKFTLNENIKYLVVSKFKKAASEEKFGIIRFRNIENGTVETKNKDIDLNKVSLNTLIELEVNAAQGYSLKSLTVNDKDIKSTYSFTVLDAITYEINAAFIKDQEVVTKEASIKVINSGNENVSFNPSLTDFETQEVKIKNVEGNTLFGGDKGIRFSSSKHAGSLKFNFDKDYTFSNVSLIGEIYGSDSPSVSLSFGNYSNTIKFTNTTNFNFENEINGNTLTISSNNKNRFYLKEIKFNITGEGPVDPTPDPDPEIKEPATVKVSQNGNGKVVLDKTEGLSGDVVKATLTPDENWYTSYVKHNGVNLSSSGTNIYTFTLEKGVNNLDVLFKEKTTTEGNYDYLYNNTIQPDRGSLGSIDSYYESCRGLKGEALKDELHSIINRGFKGFSYDHLKESFKETEVDPENKSNLVLAYTGERYPVSSFNGWTYTNREHTWPNSRGVGKSGPGADKHMQRICEQKINSKRSNMDFGEVNRSTGEALTGINAGNYVGNGYFEPKDEFKGDTARIIFYMATMYDKLELERPDNTSLFNYWSASYYHGDFEALYKWATTSIDPVSDFEVNRNNVVDVSYQHNRNPFVDHPEFIIMIYDKNYDGPGALLD